MSACKVRDRANAKLSPQDNPYARAKSGSEEGERDLLSCLDDLPAQNVQRRSPARKRPSPAPETPASDQFLTDRDVAQRYKVTKQTIWRWAKTSNTFPKPYKIEGSTRWSRNELDLYDRQIKETRQ